MNVYATRITVLSPENPAKPILDDISCTFAAGSITLLAGRTGSGKSTLLHVLSGLRKPDGGNAAFGVQPLWSRGRPDRSLMMRSGLVFQFPEHQLFAETVKKEFEYSLRPFHLSKHEREQRTRDALRMVGLSELLLERSPYTLSGGEKRKTAIATTLASRPDWLFLDEPTAGLDPQDIQTFVKWICLYRQMNQTSGGIVIASHDLDLFLPLADQVILLKQGKVSAACTPMELSACPDPLVKAEVGLPSAIRIAQAFHANGTPLINPSFTPEEMGRDILEGLSQNHHPGLYHCPPKPASAETQAADDSKASIPGNRRVLGKTVYSLDPRTKWLFCMLFSIGVFIQNSWYGIGTGGLLFMILAAAAAVPAKKIIKPLLPFLWFMALSIVVSGIEQWFTFDIERALVTSRQLVPFLLIAGAGIVFSLTTSRRMIQQGLETMLSGLSRFRFPVEATAFAASLLFRFITIFTGETERFSLIAKARGKSDSKPGTLKWKEVLSFFVPLLLSAMQQAEDLAVAMEARGYGTSRSRQRMKLRFQKPDYIAICLGSVIFLLFAGISLME